MAKNKNTGREPEETEEQTSTRQKILKVALEVFAENGVRGTTVVEIAKRVGITGGALYWYFENKEEIFNAVVQAHSQPIAALDAVKGLIPELEPKTAINFILQGMLAFFKTNMDFLRLVVSESLRDQEHSSPFLENMLNPARVFIRDCLESWREKGLVKPNIDIDSATQTLLGMAGYFLIEKALMGGLEELDKESGRFLEQVPDIFLRGILIEM